MSLVESELLSFGCFGSSKGALTRSSMMRVCSAVLLAGLLGVQAQAQQLTTCANGSTPYRIGTTVTDGAYTRQLNTTTWPSGSTTRTFTFPDGVQATLTYTKNSVGTNANCASNPSWPRVDNCNNVFPTTAALQTYVTLSGTVGSTANIGDISTFTFSVNRPTMQASMRAFDIDLSTNTVTGGSATTAPTSATYRYRERWQAVGATSFDLGGSRYLQATGDIVDSVVAPSWATGDYTCPDRANQSGANTCAAVAQWSTRNAANVARTTIYSNQANASGNPSISIGYDDITFCAALPQQVRLDKAWAANSVNGNTATATTTGGTTAATFSSTASTNTTGAAVTMYEGDVVTLPIETFGGGATAASYASAVQCTGGSPLASGAPPQTLTIAANSTPTVCTYTNTIIPPSLSITKTNNQTIYAAGQSLTYTVVVSNASGAGVGPATNAVFTDPAITNLSVSGVTCGGATGGATCPTTANTTVALMQGSGIIIPNIPAGGSVTFTITGTVSGNATGNLSNVATVSAAGNTATITDTDTSQVPIANTCGAEMYLSQGSATTKLQIINTGFNPFTFTDVYTANLSYNALGFNPNDRFLYALQTNTNVLLKIGLDGLPISLGPVTGLPNGFNYISGEISPAGDYYVKGANNSLYKINIATRTATTITLSPAMPGNGGSDLGWVGGLLYTVEAGVLYSIDPSTGAVTTIGNTGLGSAVNFGALFGSPTGLYGNENTGTGFYKFDLTTGAATKISSSPGATVNDGAHCTAAPIVFTADLGITKTDSAAIYTPGTNVVYTIVATNYGPFGAQNVTVTDALPAGITTASWSCAVNASAPTGTSCGTPVTGSGGINQTGVDLPVNGAVTFTYTVNVPATRTGDLVNTATVTPSSANVDPNPDTTHPNTATDTDKQAGTIVIIKDAVPNDPQDFAYTVTGTGLSAFSLDDDADPTLPNTRTFTGLSAGTYSVTEGALPTGWTLTSLVCTDSVTGGTASTVTGAVATIQLDAGETVTCTYVNQKSRTLTLRKTWSGAAQNDKATLSLAGAASDTLASTADATGANSTVDATPTSVPVGGSVTVSEILDAANVGQYAGVLDCGAAVTGETLGTAFVMPDADITCTVTNTRRTASLVLKKIVVNDNGGTKAVVDFGITTSAGTPTWTSTVAGTTTTYTSQTFTVNAGQAITFSEIDVANYTEGTWSCTVGTSPGTAYNAGSITLAANDATTCSITNNDSNVANLAITKTNNGGTADAANDTLTAGTPTTYTVVVTNNGPASANGAFAVDQPDPTHLQNCSVTSAVGTLGAAAPASADWSKLLTAGGVPIPTLPNGGVVTFTVQCTVQ